MKTKYKRDLVTVQLPEGIKSKIKIYAKKDGLKMSDIVRLAVHKFFRL